MKKKESRSTALTIAAILAGLYLAFFVIKLLAGGLSLPHDWFNAAGCAVVGFFVGILAGAIAVSIVSSAAKKEMDGKTQITFYAVSITAVYLIAYFRFFGVVK